MKCVKCKIDLQVRTETHVYIKDVAELKDVEVRRCPQCGEEEVVIPNIEAVHARIADMVAHEKKRLSPAKIRFLRTYLGHSSVDFAKLMGVDSSTVSRWESLKDPHSMSATEERILRLMVLGGKDHKKSFNSSTSVVLDVRVCNTEEGIQ